MNIARANNYQDTPGLWSQKMMVSKKEDTPHYES